MEQYGDDESGEVVLGTGVLCACSDLQGQSAAGGPTSSQRLRVRGMEQLYEEFEPRPPMKSQGMCQVLLSPAKSDESLQMVRQQESGLKICEEQPGDRVSVLQPGRPMVWGTFPTRK